MKALLVALIAYELFLKPKKRDLSGTDLLAQNPYGDGGQVGIEGGPSNASEWERWPE